MTKSVFCIAILALIGCHRAPGCSSRKQSDATNATDSIGDSRMLRASGASAGAASDQPLGTLSMDATWSQGLTMSVNGYIPVIVVDQFGYRTGATKVAVIRDPQIGYDSGVSFAPGRKYAVVNRDSGSVVKQGEPVPWNNGATDPSSGDRAWWFDFSDVTTPGTYAIVDMEKHVRSMEFTIGDTVYRSVLNHAVRMYYYQRAGFQKTVKNAGPDWADSASHLGPGQDSESHSWLAKSDRSKFRDLRGGWFDAGDYNKYTSWTARNVILLLHAYEEQPRAFGDDSNIAESGNNVPDALDEVKWALDWLLRMQNPDGSLLCVQGLASGRPPSAAAGLSYYGPATTAATLMGAAAYAYASKVYSARPEPALKVFGVELAARSKQAWDWASANSGATYYNNDESKQAGSRGLAAGQQEMDDSGRMFARFEAAVYLYALTGEAQYKGYLESNVTTIVHDVTPTQWDADRQEVLLLFATLSGIPDNLRLSVTDKFTKDMLTNADQVPSITGNTDPYRAPIKEYGWGSNMSKATQARQYLLFARYGSDVAHKALATIAAEDYVHYIHGVNPLGLVYLTNMKRAGAENSARTMFHYWFADGDAKWDETTSTSPGPAPGYLVGGPNPGFAVDDCCTAAVGTATYRCFRSVKYALCEKDYTPPRGQPVQKSYLQFNSGWPANSWSVTEPSTGYQAHYIRLVAAFAR